MLIALPCCAGSTGSVKSLVQSDKRTMGSWCPFNRSQMGRRSPFRPAPGSILVLHSTGWCFSFAIFGTCFLGGGDCYSSLPLGRNELLVASSSFSVCGACGYHRLCKTRTVCAWPPKRPTNYSTKDRTAKWSLLLLVRWSYSTTYRRGGVTASQTERESSLDLCVTCSQLIGSLQENRLFRLLVINRTLRNVTNLHLVSKFMPQDSIFDGSIEREDISQYQDVKLYSTRWK